MSPKNRSIVVGLTAPGLLGLAALRLAGAGEAPSPAGAPAASEAPSSPETVLLLTSDKILKGPLVEDADGYRIIQKGGEIRFPKRSVVKTFRTIREVYEYKLARIARQDPDEQMKLALWCLSQDLKAETRERLREVLDLDPVNRQAQAMLHNLETEEKRLAARAGVVDPEVARAGTSMPYSGRLGVADQPDALDQALIARVEEAQRKMGLGGLPQILDLPPDLAVNRYDKFYRYVHPVLQQSCVRCHNDQYPGNFRMVPVRVKRDWENHNVVRANLDATLGLIDAGNLMQSPLLSNALLPHGPSKQPVLRGYNDPSYRVLASWVQSLAVTRPGQPSTNASPGSEGFAADRAGVVGAYQTNPAFAASPNGAYATYGPTAGAPPAPLPPVLPPPTDDPRFPVSPLMTGQPIMPAQLAPRLSEQAPGPQEAPFVPPPAELPPLPGMPATQAPDAGPPPGAKPARKAKLDPALLEQVLKARNGGAP